MRRLLACAVVFSASVTTAGARADDANASSADRLFNEANGLVQTGHYAEACPKFEQSQKLDPAIGTQFNLADCFEHVGRTVQRLNGVPGRLVVFAPVHAGPRSGR